MSDQRPAFAKIDAPDRELVLEVAVRLGTTLPQECVAGVAINARLLQRHLDMLREAGS